jgi:twitching motility protein PilT
MTQSGLPPQPQVTPGRIPPVRTENLSMPSIPPPSQPQSTKLDASTSRQPSTQNVSTRPQSTQNASTRQQGTQNVMTPATPLPRAAVRPGPPPSLQVPHVNPRHAGQPSLAQLVKDAFEQGCSDLHLGATEQIRFRSRGLMVIQDNYPVPDEATFFSWLAEVMDDKQIQNFKDTFEFDGATQYEFARCRINVFQTLRGPAMVMRIIPLKMLSIEQLGLPEVFRELCYTHKGLILVTGPTGSGKSTTLAAMVDFINSEMPKHLISIEDPIEFVHQSKKALIKQREVGIHTHKFDNALKASLREDPDIILIGEMRDKETVNTALKAGQTGHLVFGTLHTNSAIKTIERILNLYEPDQQAPMRDQLAETLVAVIAQTLVRTTDGKRAAAHEIMINTDAIRDYIKRAEVDEIESIIPKSTFDGMCSMNQSLYKLYEDGRITEETAVENSPRPNEMAQMLRGRV